MREQSKKSAAEEDVNLEQEYQELREITVDPGQTPIRLDKYLMDRLDNVSRNRIQNAIKAGNISINDDQVKSNYKVRPQDVIRIIIPKSVHYDDQLAAEDIPLDVVFEDEDILLVNKHAGMVVHPGIGNRSGTLVNGLVHYFQNKALPVMSGNPLSRPGLVHRIDKNTTGLLVIAKTELAMHTLAKQFSNHTIERTYQCLVWGDVQEDQGTIIGNIGRHPRYRQQMTVFPEGESGKHAVTHYRVLRNFYYVSLIECHLETGRTHQIRVHMKHIGHPLFNDERYGGNAIVKGTVHQKYKQFIHNCFQIMPHHALHAKSIGFIHPTTKEKMHFSIDLPQNFKDLLAKWEKYLTYRG